MEERIRNLELQVLKLKSQTPFQEDSLCLYNYFTNLGRSGNFSYVEFIPYDQTLPCIVNLNRFEATRDFNQQPYGELSEYYEGRYVWKIYPDDSEDRKIWVYSTQPGFIKTL